MLLICLEVLEGRFSLFSCERLGSALQETIVSSKAAPEVLDMKYRSKFKHCFTNRSYLHCAILKAFYGFQEKRVDKSIDMQFFLRNVPNEILKIFKVFEKNMKLIRAACKINCKINNKDKNTTLIIFFTVAGHYYGAIIEIL